MGGAESPIELRNFLFRMFTDKHIIGAPSLIRYFLAYSISRKRYKSSWKKYEQIGGTPILKAGKEMAVQLEKSANLPVEIAYSYSHPFMNEGVQNLIEKGVETITVIPLYPQSSYTTTSSVFDDTELLKQKYPNIKFKFNQDFHDNDLFISYWENLIQKHISINDSKKPVLVFAAHSIPLYVVKKGDTYTHAIKETAKLVADKMGLQHRVSFQSKFGPVKWYGEDSKDVILQLIAEGEKNIIVVPISFISECLETIYDVDIELFPELREEIPKDIKLSRITIPYAHPLLIQTLKSLI